MGRCLQQTWAVSILLCSIWSCRSCFEISTCGSEWSYTEFKTIYVSLELYLALWYWANASRSIRYAVESGCYDSIDLGSSLTSWRSMNLTEMVLDHPFRFLSLLRTSEMFVKPIDYLLRVCEILRHCEDNAYVSYSTSGYLIWRAALWSLCLWLVADFWLWQ